MSGGVEGWIQANENKMRERLLKAVRDGTGDRNRSGGGRPGGGPDFDQGTGRGVGPIAQGGG